MIHIDRLDLIRWGAFTDRTLELDDGDSKLQLVYGGNAAGKSTMRRGIAALLFGIPARTGDAHTHRLSDLRVGARLRTDRGPVEVVRLKGKANSLRGLDGRPLSDDPISVGLHGLSAEVYAGLFEISHESLVEGGRELLAGRGAVGESLFAAAAGAGRLHRLLTALDAEATDIFRPNGRNAPLNVALAEHASAAKELRTLTVRPTHAAELHRDLAAAQQRIEQLDAQTREHDQLCGRLRRLKAVKPMLVRHAELSSELEGLGDPPVLPADAAERRVRAQRERDETERTIRSAQEALDSLRVEQAGCSDPAELLVVEPAIKGVHSQIAAVRGAAADRRKREAELRAERVRQEDLLVRIGPGMEPENLDLHADGGQTRRALERCLQRRGETAERHRSAQQRVADVEAVLEAACAELARHREVVGTDSLRAAVRAAAKLGPLEAQAREHDAGAAALRAKAESAFARLSPQPGVPIDELARQALPSAEAIERFSAQQSDLESERASIERERERLDGQVAELVSRRSGLRAVGRVPSADELEAARQRRDHDWRTVREALEAPSADPIARAERFELAVSNADQVADARITGVDELAQAAAIEAAESRIGAERDALEARARELERRRAELDSEWHATWERSGMPAPAIAEALAWLSDQERVSKLLDDAGEAHRCARAAEQTIERHSSTLAERLVAVDRSPVAGATLEELIALAESVADALDGDAAERRRGEDAVGRARAEVAKERRALDSATAEGDAWTEEWERLRESYGLDADLAPEDAAEVLRNIDEALAARRRAADLTSRIEGIDRDRREFGEEVARLCALVAPDLADIDPEQAASKLMERLGQAQRTREALDALEARIEREAADLAHAQRRLEAAKEQLEAMVAAARATDERELPELEQRAVRAAELRREIPACERDVAQAGEEAFEVLVEAGAELSGEQLDAGIAELERKLDALREERDRAQEETFKARGELERAERSEGAGQAAESAQQHLANARELVERYLVTKLSSCVLRETIERYRRKHQGPMLARANELFPMLTREMFSELYVDWGDGGDPLLVARDDRGRSLKVGQMSDGTREQLFLALRIAAIERYVESSGSVPVLFDDVFLESDDPRSERIFIALADLARRTQVIVLTHHRHLLGLAEHVVEPQRLALHELDGSGSRSGGGRSASGLAVA